MRSSSEPHSIEEIRELLALADPDRELVPCEIGHLRLGPDVVAGVAPAVRQVLADRTSTGRSAQIVLLVDETPIQRGEEDLKALVEAQLSEHFRVRRVVLSDGHRELHVSEEVVAGATRAAEGADAVVAVGGGTISDIAKLAATRSPTPGLVVVQTAASVDGYTDNVSVLLRAGVKRTVPSRWPDVVIADAQVISGAPARMNRAGYGEMTSMFTAPADWRLASLAGLEQSFHQGPIALLDAARRGIETWSPGVGRAEPGAVEELTWALAVRGVATGIAGTTACLSGVEHLVSHMLDLHHGAHHLEMGLHGAQVGVAAVVAAAAWEMCCDRLADGPPPKIAESALDPDRARTRIDLAFSALDPTGRIAAECWADYSRKLQTCRTALPRISGLLQRWPDHEPELRNLLRTSAELGAGLRAAKAAATFGELDPAVSPELANWAVSHCALMRNRFTVVDLLTLLGWWTPEDVSEVLSRAATAAGHPDEEGGAPRVA